VTNARKSRASRKREDELAAERNALVDVLNAILNMAAPKDGLLAVGLENYLGKQRHPVYVVPTPQGILVKQDREQVIVEGTNKRLFISPEVKGV
jgi:hypothetical protein